VITIKSANKVLNIIDLLGKEPFTIKEIALKLDISYECARKYVYVLNQRGKIAKVLNGTFIIK